MTWQWLVFAAVVAFSLGASAGWWARGARDRNALAVRQTQLGPGLFGWRVHLRGRPVGPLRARREQANTDRDGLEEAL